MVNILLRAFKSFIEKYIIPCTFIQTIHFQYSCNFSYANHFTINCLKSIKKNQYAFSYKSFQQFKSFYNHSNTLELEIEKWRTNQFIYGSNRAHMHIHIKPFRFSLSNKTQNRNMERSVKNKPKKVFALQFLSSESRYWVKLPHHQPLIHHKYVTIKEQPKKKKKSIVHSSIFG